MSSIFDIFVWITKGLQIFSTAKDINDTCNDESLSTAQKATRIGADSFFIVAQSVEIAASAKDECSAKVKFGTRVVAGTSDVIRQVAQEGLDLDTVGTIAFRAADIADGAVENGFTKKETLERYTNLSKAAGTIISKRKSLTAAVQITCTFTKNIIRDIRKKLSAHPEIVKAKNSNSIPELSNDDVDYFHKQVLMLKQMIDWTNLKNIPADFRNDPVLKNYICTITDKPIRFVMTLSDERDEISIIYFERDAIANWIRTNPNTAPPNWPETFLTLPIKREYIKVCRHAQKVIDDRLKAIAEDAQKELTKLIKDYPFLEHI